jgi:hypothetical protein
MYNSSYESTKQKNQINNLMSKRLESMPDIMDNESDISDCTFDMI